MGHTWHPSISEAMAGRLRAKLTWDTEKGVCLKTHVHTYTHSHMHIYTYMHTHHTHTYMHIYIFTHAYIIHTNMTYLLERFGNHNVF